MSDDFSRELEEIAKIVSANPRGLSELREMIASLPAPSPLSLPAVSQTNLPTTEDQTNELSGAPASSAGVAGTTGASAPGSISGGSILPGTLQANAFASSIRPIQMIDGPDLPTLPDPNFPISAVVFNLDDGRIYRNDLDEWHTLSPDTTLTNGLNDPTFETITTGMSVGTSMVQSGKWLAQQTVASGTTGSGYLQPIYPRTVTGDNPFNSAIIELDTGAGTGAYDQTISVWQKDYDRLGAYMSDLPFVVAAMQVMDWGQWGLVESDYSALEFTVEIISGRTTATLAVEASTTVDLKTIPAELPAQVWVACARASNKDYGIRFSLRAAKGVTASSGGQIVALGEPQLHLSATPDPAMYTPAIASWLPRSLYAYKDTVYPTVCIDLWGLEMGPGTSGQNDVRLWRPNAKQFRIDDSLGGQADLLVKGYVDVDGHVEGSEFRVNGITQVGAETWAPVAYMPGFNAAGTYTTAFTLSTGSPSGLVAIPIVVPARMRLYSVSLWNTDTTLTRAWVWRLYGQTTVTNNVLPLVAAWNGTTDSWTATVASKRTITAQLSGGLPPVLAPGVYYLVIKNMDFSNTFGIGSAASGTLSTTRVRTKAMSLPTTLDVGAATWTDSDSILAVCLNGEFVGAQQLLDLGLLDGVRNIYAPTVTRL